VDKRVGRGGPRPANFGAMNIMMMMREVPTMAVTTVLIHEEAAGSRMETFVVGVYILNITGVNLGSVSRGPKPHPSEH
jgi:hypothetical protein